MMSLVAALTVLEQQAAATNYDASTLFTNASFENGNLTGWSLTQPNATYLAAPVAGNPAIDPTIDPADVANDSTVLTAPEGEHFVGVLNPGDAAIDDKVKLVHDVLAVDSFVATGDTFSVIVLGNRGRLEPFDTPASDSVLLVEIFGWNNIAAPTIQSDGDWNGGAPDWKPGVQTFTFGLDGSWVSQSFVFDPAADGFDAGTLNWISYSLTLQNFNHDNYVGADIIPEPATAGLVGVALAGFVAGLRRLKS